MSVQKMRIMKGFSFTQISNKVIQNLHNYEALGLYAYLLSLPEEWFFYKKQLAEQANIGREKINSLLKILAAHNLIAYEQVRNESGRFAHFDLRVKDGHDFKIIDLENCASPLTEKPLTVNRLPVNSTYIENINKININKKEISKNIYASGDARAKETFDIFWINYKRKKDKARTYQIWCKHKLWEKSEEIMLKLLQQNSYDSQYQTMKYIPHPSTYLKYKRWEDSITRVEEHPVTAAINELKEKSPEFREFLLS